MELQASADVHQRPFKLLMNVYGVGNIRRGKGSLHDTVSPTVPTEEISVVTVGEIVCTEMLYISQSQPRGGSGTSQMGGQRGGTIPAGGSGGPQYAAELRIYWRILQLN